MSGRKQPIIYSAISKNREIIRFSAHPVLDSENEGRGPQFDVPVLWDMTRTCNCSDCRERATDPLCLMYSCRDKQTPLDDDFLADTDCSDPIGYLLTGEIPEEDR